MKKSELVNLIESTVKSVLKEFDVLRDAVKVPKDGYIKTKDTTNLCLTLQGKGIDCITETSRYDNKISWLRIKKSDYYLHKEYINRLLSKYINESINKNLKKLKLGENRRSILAEGKVYKTWVISLGEISIQTGRTRFGWSIYEDPNVTLNLVGNLLLFGEIDKNPNAIYNLYDNDSQQSRGGSLKYIDSCKCKKEEVLKMLYKHGFDYYPSRPFQKKTPSRKVRFTYSVKGYVEEKNDDLYNKILNNYAYEFASRVNRDKDTSRKSFDGYLDLVKNIEEEIGDSSKLAVDAFLDYANSKEGKDYFAKNVFSMIASVLSRMEYHYNRNLDRLKADRAALKIKIKPFLEAAYKPGGLFYKGE